MKVIIPMAGTGNRFIQNGYKDPKPLIKINKKRIIEYVLDMFDEKDDIIFICNDVHLNETDMRSILMDLSPRAKIISIPQHKNGPVFTVKYAYDHIDDEEEVVVSYCDNPLIWEKNKFQKFVNDQNMAGCVLTHTGFHPHTLANTKMAFVRDVKNTNLFDEIKEKECYTKDAMSEHASTGVYYFNKGKYIKKYFDQALKDNIQHAGEYYVTLVYNLLIKDGLKVGYYDTDFVTVFGTPEEVQNFEAWQTILTKGQVKNENDLIKAYNYWKNYNQHGNSR
jgi:NDP-sugar pyrophosphorylase family protein